MTKPLAIPRSRLNPRYHLHDRIVGVPVTALGRVVNMRPVPNILTGVRFVLCMPFFYFLYETLFQYSAANLRWTMFIMLLIGLTDCIDGYIAHKFEDCCTQWGATYDPLADKLAVFGSYTIFGIWFISSSPGDDARYGGLLAYLGLVGGYIAIVIYRAMQDIESTILYFRFGGSSIRAGKIKFVIDLLTQALGLLGVYLVNRHDRSTLGVLCMMTACAALASLFARLSLIAKHEALDGTIPEPIEPTQQFPSLINGLAEAYPTSTD